MKRKLDHIIRESKVLHKYNDIYDVFDMKEDTLDTYIMKIDNQTFIKLGYDWVNINKLTEAEYAVVMRKLGDEV